MARTRTVRGDVVEYLADKAAFRASIEEPPWERKNACYAESLRLVMAYVESLPDSDPTLCKLAQCEALFRWGGFDAPKDGDGRSETDNVAIHCGPRGRVIAEADCAEWFAFWVETAIEEAGQAQGQEDWFDDLDDDGEDEPAAAEEQEPEPPPEPRRTSAAKKPPSKQKG
jgi:hypothetical protein